MIWIFISIGLVGAVFLTTIAIFNLITCLKDKSFKNIVLKTQILLLITNITFFIYALGISIYNLDSAIFWNSMPTWIGNSIPLIINSALIIGKIIYNHKLKKSQVHN